SSDGVLDLTLGAPRALGGTSGRGASPEQLFAACYAASLLGTMKDIAARSGLPIPRDTSVVAIVGLGPGAQGFGIEVELRVSLPGVPRAEADSLVEKSHARCPYSNAMRGNVSVRLALA